MKKKNDTDKSLENSRPQTQFTTTQRRIGRFQWNSYEISNVAERRSFFGEIFRIEGGHDHDRMMSIRERVGPVFGRLRKRQRL